MVERLSGYDPSQGEDLENGPERLDSVEQRRNKPVDALVVFGFGIRSDADLNKMDDSGSENKVEEVSDLSRMRLPIGAKLRTVAAAEIFLQGQVQDVIITGGRVKESEGVDVSEAQLMKDYMEKILRKRWRKELKDEGKSEDEIEVEIDQRWADADSRILLEDKATNTIENFSHTVNFIDQNKDKYQRVAMLSNEFHIDRIMQIADKLQVSGEGVSAEPTVASARGRHYERFINNYYDLEGNVQYRQEVLEAINPEDERAREAAEARLGTSHEEMLRGERRWSRGLTEVPEYWLSNVRFIEDPNRLRMVLKAEQRVQELLTEYGIDDIDSASYDQIVNTLGRIERILPPQDWEKIPERNETVEGLHSIVFSDVDGTLVDSDIDTSKVRISIKKAEQNNMMIILCSSRAALNLISIQEDLGIDARSPVVFENGAGVLIPVGLLTADQLNSVIQDEWGDRILVKRDGNYWLFQLGEPKEILRERFDSIASLFNGSIQFILDMSPEEVMSVYDCSREIAEKVLRQEGEEKKAYLLNFIVNGEVSSQQRKVIDKAAQKVGLKITKAKKSWHLMSSESDKGKAVKVVQRLMREYNPGLISIGIGDAENDIEMLGNCDRSYSVDEDLTRWTRLTTQKGPRGWIEAIEVETKNRSGGV